MVRFGVKVRFGIMVWELSAMVRLKVWDRFRARVTDRVILESEFGP